MQNKKLKFFDENYWKMYEPILGASIDGVDNAEEYANYIKSCLDLAEVDVRSIMDFGFGNGILFSKILEKFKSKYSFGIEPSRHIFEISKKNKTFKKYKTILSQDKIQNVRILKKFELGICNSVFQYISTPIVPKMFKKISKNIHYLYFTVPTIEDYKIMNEELNFQDEFAIQRSKKFYLESLKPYFRIVSYNLLESKVLQKESRFPYELFIN